MHFTTRSFDEVVALDEQMRTRCIIPTRRTNLALLKTRLQLGHLDNALQHFREVGEGFRDLRATASSAPRHIAMQLVELGCREHRVGQVLEALEMEASGVDGISEVAPIVLSACASLNDPTL